MKVIYLLAITMASIGLGDSIAPYLTIAPITSVQQIGREGDYRVFQVDYLIHCGDENVGVFVTTVPTAHVTEHVHHMVGAAVLTKGRLCDAADRAASAKVLIPLGDVVDTSPAVLQPER